MKKSILKLREFAKMREFSKAREFFWVLGPAIIVMALAFIFTYQFVKPAPPSEISIATGGKSGGFYAFGEQYASLLKEAGITLKVDVTAGSVENVKRVTTRTDQTPRADVALIQGGIANAKTAPNLVSLGRMFLEPVWVFYKGNTLTRLSDFRGKLIAVGAQGSGTRKLATDLLTMNDISEQNTRFSELSGDKAVEALEQGSVDGVIMVAAFEAPMVQNLLKNPDIQLLNFDQAEAYTRLMPYLSHVVLPKGVIDLVANKPSDDVSLLAASAVLAARDDLHPALLGLLSQAAQKVHSRGSMFQKVGDFPKIVDPEFPMADEAVRVYKTGAPLLQRFLPFWLASFLERMFILALPMVTVMLPLIKIVPVIYKWRIRRRLLHWYAKLKALEYDINNNADQNKTAQFREQLEEIEDGVSYIPVPLAYADQLYDLKSAIGLVSQRLESRRLKLVA